MKSSLVYSLESESVQPCDICGRVWTRGDYRQFIYFNGLVLCREHPGVMKFYEGALEWTDVKLKLSGVEFI